jgi:hypothetical protein
MFDVGTEQCSMMKIRHLCLVQLWLYGRMQILCTQPLLSVVHSGQHTISVAWTLFVVHVKHFTGRLKSCLHKMLSELWQGPLRPVASMEMQW